LAENKQKTHSGGVDINASNVNIEGDFVGRDKVTNVTAVLSGDELAKLIQTNLYWGNKALYVPRMVTRPPGEFVGREVLLRELIGILKEEHQNTGPIALVGMGGIGKTTLAEMLATHAEVEAAFPHGTLRASLGRKPEVTSLLGSWIRELTQEDAARPALADERRDFLRSILHDRKVLLLIDDVCQAEDGEYFSRIGGKGCRVLITTRNREVASGLNARKIYEIGELTGAASLELLRRIAPEAVADHKEDASKLATALGGLPLALILVGNKLASKSNSMLNVSRTLAELKKREPRFEWTDVQKKLQAVFSLTYDYLLNATTGKPDKTTQRAFRRLGAFGGKPLTFSLQAAASLWNMDLFSADYTMTTLVSHSLVMPASKERFFIHALLSEYATKLLSQHHEATSTQQAHAYYYLAFAKKHANGNGSAVELELGQIRRGFESVDPLPLSLIFRALDWLVNKLPPRRQPITFDYFAAMDSFFDRRGLWDEQLKWVQKALKVAKSFWNRRAEGRFYNKMGSIQANMGSWNEALASYQHSSTISKKRRDHIGLAATFNNIGRVYANKGEWNRALEHYEKSLSLWKKKSLIWWKKIGTHTGLAIALDNIGSIYYDKGEWDKALDHYKQSYATHTKMKDLEGRAVALRMLGLIYAQQESWDKAFTLLKRSQRIFNKCGNRVELATTYNNIGGVYFNKQELDYALVHFSKALESCTNKNAEQTELAQSLAQALHGMARVYHNKEEWGKALELYERSCIIRETLGERVKLAQTRWKMSELYETQGQLEQAEQILTEAVAIFKEVGSPDYEQAGQQLEKIKALRQRALQNR
jgi:tetratricopeptide (TPR) repeat protein